MLPGLTVPGALVQSTRVLPLSAKIAYWPSAPVIEIALAKLMPVTMMAFDSTMVWIATPVWSMKLKASGATPESSATSPADRARL